jgi:hypothetical protein
MELTEKQKQEINDLFKNYRIHNDEEKLLKELEKYKFEDGSYSLFIRWKLDYISTSNT